MSFRVLIGIACTFLWSCTGGTDLSEPADQTTSTWYTVIERAEAIVACMQDRGVNAELVESFAVAYRPGYENVYDDCNAEIDKSMPFPPPMSDEESYQAWQQLAECIRDLGYLVDPAPSLDVWIEEKNENWDPYEYVGLESFGAVHEECPQPGLGLEPKQ
jgi:hypothetical protein